MGSEVAGDPRAKAWLSAVQSAAHPDARAWLERSWFLAGAAFSRAAFFGSYAGAARRFPGSVADLAPELRERLSESGIALPEAWALADLVRALLLWHAVADSPGPQAVALCTEVFRRGDSAERAALLRALPLLPQPARFLELAIEACRSHVLEVFAAIACDNPFPAAHFPEPNFNQLAIKTLFVELPLDRVLGWRSRANAELRRMATDYAAERRAAGRPVPTDVALIQNTETPA